MSEVKKKSTNYVSLFALFTVWYVFNAGYNVYNAKLKTDLKYPIIISCLQLAVGLFYAIPLWVLGFRTIPNLNFQDLLRLFPIAALNAIGHSTTVVAMFQLGGGSFTHVIKASEPVVSVILGLLINGAVPKPLTALSLFPISYGVAYASTLGNLNVATMAKELTTLAAVMAMIGNVSFALRSILRKNLPADFKTRTKLDSANDNAVIMIYSALLTLPFCFLMEYVIVFVVEVFYLQRLFCLVVIGSLFIICYHYHFDTDILTLLPPHIIQSPTAFLSSFQHLAQSTQNSFLLNLFLCGMCFVIYNEVQNQVLGSLGAVPTAVGNTLKRVFIFVSLYLFTENETFPVPKIIGCAIAIAGCLAFAIFDSWKI